MRGHRELKPSSSCSVLGSIGPGLYPVLGSMLGVIVHDVHPLLDSISRVIVLQSKLLLDSMLEVPCMEIMSPACVRTCHAMAYVSNVPDVRFA